MVIKVIKNVDIYAENETIKNGYIRFQGSKIVEIGSMEKYFYTEDVIQEVQEGSIVIPGMIDIHVHGSNGFDAMDESEEALDTIASSLAKEGTTSFLATTMTQENNEIIAALKTMSNHIEKDACEGAELLGIHLEGPFVSVSNAGAQPKQHIKKPDVEVFKKFQEAANGNIKIVTIAPECDEDLQLVKYLNSTGVIPSMGHSNASSEIARSAYKCGAKHVTHFYNGLTPLHHREAGIVGHSYYEDGQYIELICDGVHVAPEMVKLTLKIKGADRMLLVTDSMRAKNLADGEYSLGGQKVIVTDRVPRTVEGAIAGSVLRMEDAFKNIIEFTGCTMRDAITMTSKNQAERLGIYDRKGSLAVGKDADVVVLDKKTCVTNTFCRGNLIR